MSLYVRVFTNFYSHRKTARLRIALGNDAFWVPPRLWAYAAENQPDGDFADYKPEELAILIGYSGDATSMVQALIACGFLDSDPLRIHDWKDHNGYHEVFAVRAKKAAASRWKGNGNRQEKDKTRKERKGKETSNACENLSNASSIQQACEQIYAEYPRKVGKPDALKAILRAVTEATAPVILEKTKAYAKSRAGQDVKFTPHPATWFNQKRFNDDLETCKPSQNGASQPDATYPSGRTATQIIMGMAGKSHSEMNPEELAAFSECLR